MRRKNREAIDFQEIAKTIDRCPVLRLGKAKKISR